MDFKLLYLPPNTSPWSLHWHHRHSTSQTEVTTLSFFPKPWLICFLRVHATANHVVIRARSLASAPLPPALHILEQPLPHSSFSSGPFPFTFPHCPNLEAQSSLAPWHIAKFSLWQSSLPVQFHSRIPRILQKSILHSQLRPDFFTLLLLATQGLCPPHREKRWTPGLVTMTCPDFGLLFILY